MSWGPDLLNSAQREILQNQIYEASERTPNTRKSGPRTACAHPTYSWTAEGWWKSEVGKTLSRSPAALRDWFRDPRRLGLFPPRPSRPSLQPPVSVGKVKAWIK